MRDEDIKSNFFECLRRCASPTVYGTPSEKVALVEDIFNAIVVQVNWNGWVGFRAGHCCQWTECGRTRQLVNSYQLKLKCLSLSLKQGGGGGGGGGN